MPGFGGKTQTTDDEESTKGLKAGSLILIDEGSFEVSSKDDSFHSNGDIEINGGSFTAAAVNFIRLFNSIMQKSKPDLSAFSSFNEKIGC